MATPVIDTADVALSHDQARRLQRVSNRVTQTKEMRDALIFEAANAGAGVREIARVTGLSHPGVIHIVKQQAELRKRQHPDSPDV